MHVLIVNAGSSSLRLSLLADDDSVQADAHFERWDDAGHDAVRAFVDGLPARVDAVGHRVVHGGLVFQSPVVIDDNTLAAIEELTPLAPLHQPHGVDAIRLMQQLLPQAPAVACFDTAFHATLPDAASTYALPLAWRERWGLRRFGFHGLSHAYASRRAGAPRVVVAHLGAGASLCAVRDGASVDTTMGFTPMEGVVMATRSGSVDPGMVLWLVNEAGLDAADVERALRSESGLAGLSGGSGDMREVMAGIAAGDPRAVLAFDVYVHRLAAGIAAMAASLGGVDALVFTGGVGEHEPSVRAGAVERLAFLGLALDPAVNRSAKPDADVSAPGASSRTLVIAAREDLEMARLVRSAVST